MSLYCVSEDITKLEVDAVVNAANPGLRHGGGVCGAIFRAAGAARLQAACDRYGHCDTGKAVITGGFSLPAEFIIHTVGPRYQQGNPNQASQLYGCYQNSLILAGQLRLRSIAFPLISSGVYGYPKEEAVKIAIGAIMGWLANHDIDVYLCILDPHLCAMATAYQNSWIHSRL